LVFGKIDYLNLLPFHVFMKRFLKSSSQKMSINSKKGVPSKINAKFVSRKVDAAFISSIRAQGYKNADLGIIANKEVLSVLVIPSANNKSDKESETSNALAKVLEVNGEVIIGDKALKYYLTNKPHVDLATLWYEKYELPFVFALLCYHRDEKVYKTMQKRFLKQKIKIPQYILKEASKRTKIKEKDILNYLNYISYDLTPKAKMGLRKFYKEAKKI
jgi:chorismate dehydratase